MLPDEIPKIFSPRGFAQQQEIMRLFSLYRRKSNDDARIYLLDDMQKSSAMQTKCHCWNFLKNLPTVSSFHSCIFPSPYFKYTKLFELHKKILNTIYCGNKKIKYYILYFYLTICFNRISFITNGRIFNGTQNFIHFFRIYFWYLFRSISDRLRTIRCRLSDANYRTTIGYRYIDSRYEYLYLVSRRPDLFLLGR